MWSAQLIRFYEALQPFEPLPNNTHWLHPQQHEEVRVIMRKFYGKYFSDNLPRSLLLGINPGRFGAGVTGINFTAPRQLSLQCQLEHPFRDQSELSAEFIYEMIEAYGGPNLFYQHYFIGSVCPLGFVREGKNINYYDDPALQEAVTPFIIQSIEKQLLMPVNRKQCFSIGGEKNFRFLNRLNATHGWFEEIVALPHPRFIMQYRRKTKENFIQLYLDKLHHSERLNNN